MTTEPPAGPASKGIPTWLIACGLAPALWLMACGFFIGPIHIHPESPDFPHWKVDLLFGGMIILDLLWAFVVMWKSEIHWLMRVPTIVGVAIIAHFVNFVIAMAGCGVIGGVFGLLF